MAAECAPAALEGGSCGSDAGAAAAAAAATVAASSASEQPRPAAGAEDEAETGPPPPPPPPPPRQSRLPLSRIKALMKADPDLSLTGQEAVFVIAKATELFIETIAKDAFIHAQQGKRKTLQRKDLDNAIEAIDEFAFLEGTLD
ncbi:DNA polymerase epsilon subunit 4-like [Rhinatrema bivittatum]|uniref:DNA polymerase epsilon subunit 4-like n=1 Tax=Rhinatrema bivittatum TaxID=194408 RepID=UPI0011283335|nr:DNA polymerase epsilon subunit 4-like [Rhinatrema bivittatum]